MPSARLLTTSRCPGYVRALAATGHRVDAVPPLWIDSSLAWDIARELSDSVRSVDPDAAFRGLERGVYDAVLCHSVHDLHILPASGSPTVLVVHERRELLDLFADGPDSWDAATGQRIGGATIVCAGEDIAASWAGEATDDVDEAGDGRRAADVASFVAPRIIPPAVNVNDWPSAEDRQPEAVTVAPFAVERALFDTAYLVATLINEVGLTVLGVNPGLGIESNTASLPARRRAFARSGVYVNLSSPGFEPAAPMPMLEAMAAGLPIVTLAHGGSPIVDGVNGLVARSAPELVEHTRRLRKHPDMARRLGDRARETVAAHYAPERFAARWTELVASLPRPTRRIA